MYVKGEKEGRVFENDFAGKKGGEKSLAFV